MHPIRVSLLGLLRIEGPLTVTRATELLGESSSSCSFHVGQLAKYGLVEEAGGAMAGSRPTVTTPSPHATPNAAVRDHEEKDW